MNKTLVSCYTSVFDVSLLTSRQLIIITIVNMILMSSNVIANAVVIYILIKTGQISNITSKLIFMLSASDLLQGFISQNLLTATFCETNCSVNDASRFLSVFLSHLSNYTIVIMGVDRYLRIKHFVNFKIMWTSRVVLKLIFLAFCIALLKALKSIVNNSWFVTRSKVCCLYYLYCIGRYYIRYDNNSSNQNYLDIKSFAWWINSHCFRKNQQEGYKIKYANYVIFMFFPYVSLSYVSFTWNNSGPTKCWWQIHNWIYIFYFFGTGLCESICECYFVLNDEYESKKIYGKH